jgi:hypothetical protein
MISSQLGFSQSGFAHLGYTDPTNIYVAPNGSVDITLDGATLSAAGDKGGAPVYELLEAEFTKVADPDYLVPNPPNLVEYTDTFANAALYESMGTAHTDLTVAGNVGTIANATNGNTYCLLTAASVEIPHLFVEVQLEQIGASGGQWNNGAVGIMLDDANWLVAFYDSRGYFGIQIANGVGVYDIAGAAIYLSAPCKIGLSLSGNYAACWLDSGSGFQRINGGSVASHYDFCATGAMAGWVAGIKAAGPVAATWKFSNLKAGRFGTGYVRDTAIVLNDDGTPHYCDANSVYFTASCGSDGGAYIGVFTLDLRQFTINQTGVILVNRSGGFKPGDSAAHIVVGANNQRLLFSGWGTSPIKIWTKNFTGTDILNGTTVVTDAEQLTLPVVAGEATFYDPFVMWDSVQNVFLMSYIATNNLLAGSHPYLVSTTDFETFTRIGQDTSVVNWEGPRITRDSTGNIYVLTGGQYHNGSNSSRVYNREMQYLGALNCVFEGNTNVPPPHPMVFQAGGQYVILTFNGVNFNADAVTYGQPQVFTTGDLIANLVANISDTMAAIADRFEPPAFVATALTGALADALQIPYDEVLSVITANFTSCASDTLKVIQDLIAATRINMTGSSQRWVAPVSITPISEGVDPLYLAAHAIRHPGRYYEPRIKSYGTFTRAISAPVGFIKTGDGDISVLDPDNSIRQRIAAKTITGASAEVRLGPEGGSFAGFLRPLDRQIGTVSQPADGEMSFPLQDSISKYLDQSIPGLVDLTNFPDLPEDSAGAFAPIIYGRVSANEYDTITSGGWWFLYGSSYSTQGGAIKPILVKSAASNYRYLIARHPCLSVELWKKKYDEKSFIIVPVGDYTLIDEVIASGETCQIAKFTVDQGDYEIRANVKGLYDSLRYSFVGFFGRHGTDYITNIGLIVKDSVTGDLIRTVMAGLNTNMANVDFADTDIPSGQRVSAINIWIGPDGYHVDALQLEYVDSAGTTTMGIKHGGSYSGVHSRFVIIEGEYITGISGPYETHIDGMTITSNLVPVSYGHTTGSNLYEIHVNQSTGSNFSDAILSMLTNSIGITNSLDRINLASFEETRVMVQDLICAGAITEQITWGEAITRLQRSSNIDLFADKNDRLTVCYTSDDVEFNDGFEEGLGLWENNSNPSYVVQTSEQAYAGTYSLKAGAHIQDTVYLTKNISSRASLSFSVRTRFRGPDGIQTAGDYGMPGMSVAFLSFNDAIGPQLSLCTHGPTTIELRRGDYTGELLGTITGLTLYDTWNKISGYFEIGSSGHVVIKIADIERLNFSGNTQAQSAANVTEIRLGGQGVLYRWAHGYYDSFSYGTYRGRSASIHLSDLVRLYKGTVRQQLAGPTFNQIPYRYSPNYASDNWTEDTYDNAADQAAYGGVLAEDPLQLYFVRDPSTALAVVENRAKYLSLDAFRIEGQIPLVPVLQDLELGSIVSIDHFGGIKIGGYTAEQFKIIELAMDIDNLRYTFKGIRIPPPE